MYFIYIIECEDGSLYTGITTDIDRRFAEHESGKGSRYTAAHRAKKILYLEGRQTRSEALRREAQIKKLRRADKLQLINGRNW